MPVAKRIGLALFVVVMVIGLLVAGVLLFATSSAGSKWISDKLKQTFRETGFEVAFTNIDLQFFPPRLVLENLRAGGIDIEAGCRVEEVEIAPDPFDLLAGRLTVEEIYLGAPDCRVSLNAADMARLRAASKAGDDSSDRLDLSFLPPFDVVALSDGVFHVEIDDPAHLGTVGLDVDGLYLDITGRGEGRQQIEIRALLEQASGSYRKDDVQIRENLDHLALRAGLSEEELVVRTFEGHIAGAVLSGRELQIPIPLKGDRLNAMFISVDVPLDVLGRLPIPAPPMKGTAGFSGQVGVAFPQEGPPDVTARGVVRLRNGAVDVFTIGDVDGTVSFSNRGVSFSELEIRTADGSLTTTGNVDFSEGLPVEAAVDIDDIELARLLENLDLPDAYAMLRISGKVNVKGKILPLELRGTTDLDTRDLAVFDKGFTRKKKEFLLQVPKVHVRGPFSISPGGFFGKSIAVRSGNSRVETDMRFGFSMKSGWDMQIRSDQFDLADVRKITGFQVGGQGSLSCRIKAPGYGTPVIDAEAAFRRFRFAGYDFNRVKSSIRFDGQKLLFESIDVWGRESHFGSQQIALDFDAPGGLAVAVKVDIERAELDDMARSFHVDTKGWGSPGGFVAGTMDITYAAKPEKLLVTTALSHEGLTLFNEVFGPGVIEGTYDTGALVLTRLDMSKGRGRVDLSGAMAADGALNFVGLATDVALEDIVFPAVSDLEVTGRGQVYAVLKGTVAHPRGEMTVRLSDTVRKGLRYGPSEMELTLDGDRLTARGTVAGRSLVLEHGVADFGDNRFALEAFVSDLDAVRLLGLDRTSSDIGVLLTGEMDVQGNLSGPPNLTGQVRMFDLSLRYRDITLHNRAPVVVDLRNNRFLVSASKFSGKNVAVEVEGDAGLSDLRLVLKGAVNLQAVTELTDLVSRAEGKLGFNVVVSGPYDDLSFRGNAEVADGAFLVDGFPNEISDVKGRVELGASVIRFDDFSARSAGGVLDMDGWIALKGGAMDDYRFRLRLADLELTVLEDLNLRVSTVKDGLVMAPGKKRKLPFVSGDVEVSNLKYTQDVHIIEVSDLNVTGLSGKRRATRKPRLFDRNKDVFEYDIHLHGDRNLAIVNNLLDTRLRIDDRDDPLRLVGSNQSVGFLGSVESQGGTVRFAGNTFEIRNAAVTFKDSLRPDNPFFRVTADTEIRDWKITITAEGTVEEYEVFLSAQPWLSKEDVIMLLLTKMLKEEHAQFGSTGLSMSLAPIIENVSSGVIPVEVSVYSEYSEKAGGDTTRVALGRKLTDRLWVQVSSSIGQGQDVEGLLTYRINDNLSLSASYDNKDESSKTGNWGLDLKFRLEF